MNKIKVVVLGQGRSGRDIHCANLTKIADKYEIVAIVDPLEDRRVRAKNEFNCEVYSNYKELFSIKSKIDLVVNATPSHLHVPVTLDLLSNGFNVLCEKPFAHTANEVDKMINTAKEKNVFLAVFQQSRFAPAYTEIRRIIDSGVLEKIIQISIAYNGFQRRWDWQTVQDFNAGSLYNTGPHPVDQALQFLNYQGKPDVKCYMNRVNTYGDAEDYVKLLLTAPNKPVIDVEISSCCAYPSFTYNIQAQNGGLNGSTTHIDYKYFKPEESPEQNLIITPLMKEDGTPKYCGETLKWYEESWDIPSAKKELFYYMTCEFYSMLYGVIREGKTLEITPLQVKQQIEVMEEAHRQNPMNKTVSV